MDDRPGPPTHGPELGRWVADLLGDRQGASPSPARGSNTLETLFADPRIVDPLGAGLVEMRAGFLSLEVYGSFGRYALSQLDRLENNQRLADHRAAVIRWIQDDPALELDAAAERLAREAKVAAPTDADAVARARDYLKQLYRSMYDQGVISGNEWSALRAAARLPLGLPRDLRPKNAYNLIRLLDLAIRWLRGEPPDVRALGRGRTSTARGCLR